VKGIVSRDYTFTKMEKRQITVHVNTDQVGWTTMNYWTWGGDDTHAPKNGTWPGDRITQTKSVNGKNWFYKTFTLNSADDFVNFVFSTGTGSPQTVDVENVREDKFFEVLNQQSGNKYQVADVTVETGIEQPERDLQPARQAAVYTLDGRQVRRGTSLDGLPRGVYVVNGRKVVR
jgi:alpha-amylase